MTTKLRAELAWNYYYDDADRAVVEVRFRWDPDIGMQFLPDPYRALFSQLLDRISDEFDRGAGSHFKIETGDDEKPWKWVPRMSDRNDPPDRPAFVRVALPINEEYQPTEEALARLARIVKTEIRRFRAEGQMYRNDPGSDESYNLDSDPPAAPHSSERVDLATDLPREP